MLNKQIILPVLSGLILIFSQATGSAQGTSSLTNNIERAYTVLNDVYNELNYNNTVGDVKMKLKGSYYYEGVKDDPASIRSYTMHSSINFSKAGNVLLRKDTFTRPGVDAITSFYDITESEMNITVANEEKKADGADKEKYLYESLIFNPNLLLQFMLRDASMNSFISSDDKHHIIRHNNGSGNVFFLFINSKSYYLERIEQPMYDPVTGDYFRTITYSKYDIQDGYQAPGKVTIHKDSTLVYDLSIDLIEMLPRVDYGSTVLRQQKVGDWLKVVPMDEWNSRSVIADMGDFLVVLGPPATTEAAYTLLDNIKKAYNGKEVKYCVVSHYHPEHIGGVRPFMEEGAMIVTTEKMQPYFQQMARNKHTYSKDVRLKKFISPKFLFIKSNGQEIRANNKKIELYLLNKKSRHTDEYLISYFPNDKILVEGDLVNTSNLREGRTLNAQEKGLVEFLDAVKVSPKQIIQTWPAKNTPNVFDYNIIKPESKLIKGSKKLLEVFE